MTTWPASGPRWPHTIVHRPSQGGQQHEGQFAAAARGVLQAGHPLYAMRVKKREGHDRSADPSSYEIARAYYRCKDCVSFSVPMAKLEAVIGD